MKGPLRLTSALFLNSLVVFALAAQTPQDPQTVPVDLRPLLLPRKSEMRLVVSRYGQDRSLMASDFAGAGGGRGGGGNGRGGPGGATVPPVGGAVLPPITISPARLARLKRFDMNWEAALNKIDASKLSAEAKLDRDSLLVTVRNNLASLEKENGALATATPLLPFATEAVNLIESRLRLEDLKAEASARALDHMNRQIIAIREQLGTNKLTATREQALLAASATSALRSNITQWSGFYQGYDPLFNWWVPMPYRKLDATMSSYVAFLRDTLKAPDVPATGIAVKAIVPTPMPKYNDVPDLGEIIGLTQDEMIGVVDRFFERGGGRGGRGGGGNATHDVKYYTDWLAALKSLDFDHLTRNAQVDYLYIKKMAELQVERVGHDLPPGSANTRLTDTTGIPGPARGRDGLIRDLQDELIPYTPEQLMKLAESEFAWCDKEMLKASREMGFGDNWKAAVEKTKTRHVDPGQQPGMIRDLIFEAADFLRARNLVTVPQVDYESQKMSMMSAQSQLSNPFFLGGSEIQVSFPTDGMDFDARQQSMRGNNRDWSHATAFHEMIPGHNMQGFISSRFNGYRASFGSTPFYTEGWALYWELTMYDKGFHATPEQRVGALVWRMHRCARIIFSLKFHMGQWSPEQAINFLVDRVGHERDNAKAEVKRSFQGGYGPLYQAGYLLGGLQIRGLRRELVDTKQMTEVAFHDEILRQGNMPINLLRLGLTKQKLTRDMDIGWKFYGDLPDK